MRSNKSQESSPGPESAGEPRQISRGARRVALRGPDGKLLIRWRGLHDDIIDLSVADADQEEVGDQGE